MSAAAKVGTHNTARIASYTPGPRTALFVARIVRTMLPARSRSPRSPIAKK
jgi:hypothetical protein